MTSRAAPDGVLKAVLWDMDGTLVDTEPYWIKSEYQLAEKYGGAWSDHHAMQIVGGDLLDSARYIREHMGIDRTPEQIRDELLSGVISQVKNEVPWRPGARELLAQCRAAGLATALVTMSYRSFAQPVVAELPPGSFDLLVVGDEVSRGKPHPDPYLAAARGLGLAPAQTLAIEDSPTGASSAEAAGCAVLVVPCQVEVPRSPRRHFRDSLESLSVSDLSRIVGIHADGLASQLADEL